MIKKDGNNDNSGIPDNPQGMAGSLPRRGIGKSTKPDQRELINFGL